MKLRVESTETGEVFNLRLEPTIDKLKLQVKLFTQILPHDQILLFGPPFKILDSQYGPNLKLDNKRIFVFNRRILTDDNLEHSRLRLLPFEVPLIQSLDDSQTLLHSPSPSSQYLLEFEKYFQDQLKRGQCYEQFIQDVYNSCRASVAQHRVQLCGIEAAIHNLRDTYSSIRRPYESLEKRLSAQQLTHRGLLDSFEDSIARLQSVQLHPSLISAIERARLEGGNSSISQSATVAATEVQIRTLYDCIPAERERVYFVQCEDSHRKVEEQLVRVRTLYGLTTEGIDQLAVPLVDFDQLEAVLGALDLEVAAVGAVVTEMRRNYQFVYDAITNSSAAATNSTATEVRLDSDLNVVGNLDASTSTAAELGNSGANNSNSSGLVHHQQHAISTSQHPAADLEALVSDLARRKFSQERQQHLAALEARAAAARTMKGRVEDSQNALIAAIYATLRRVARFQTDIQYKLKRDVEWMRKWTQGHNEYFRHLEHIAALPDAYQHLLREVVRRRAYNGVFESEVSAASERINKLRADEIRERELFMSIFGLSLPPVFFRAIPTLKDKPPYFNPHLTEEQWLPDVAYEDLDLRAALFARDTAAGENEGVAEYVYTNQQQHEQLSRLTAVRQQPGPATAVDEYSSESSENRTVDLSTAVTTTDTRTVNQAALDALLAGGTRVVHSNNASAMMGMSSSFGASGLAESTAPQQPSLGADEAADRPHADVGGRSVILPAVNPRRTDEGAYEELLARFNRQTYENSKLLGVIEDLQRQLASSSGGNGTDSKGTRSHSNAETAMTPPPLVEPMVPKDAISSEEQQHKQSEIVSPLESAAPVIERDATVGGLVPEEEQVDSGVLAGPDTVVATSEAVIAAATDSASHDVTTIVPTYAEVAAASSTAVVSHSVVAEDVAVPDDAPSPSQVLLEESAQAWLAIRALLNSSPKVTAYLISRRNVQKSQLTSLASSTSGSSMRSGDNNGSSFEQLQRRLSSELSVLRSEVPVTRCIPGYADEGSTMGSVVADVVEAACSLLEAVDHSVRFEKLSFNDFQVGDIALFMPSDESAKNNIWCLFQSHHPYRYLSDASLDSFRQSSRSNGNRSYLVGRIVAINSYVAQEGRNPYNLPLGAVFYVLDCEMVKTRPGSSSSGSAGSGAGAKRKSKPSAAAASQQQAKLGVVDSQLQAQAQAQRGGPFSSSNSSSSER